MIRKSYKTTSGVKAKTNLNERAYNTHDGKLPYESPTRIKNCLNCKKPAKECKGNCYGR